LPTAVSFYNLFGNSLTSLRIRQEWMGVNVIPNDPDNVAC